MEPGWSKSKSSDERDIERDTQPYYSVQIRAQIVKSQVENKVSYLFYFYFLNYTSHIKVS